MQVDYRYIGRVFRIFTLFFFLWNFRRKFYFSHALENERIFLYFEKSGEFYFEIFIFSRAQNQETLLSYINHLQRWFFVKPIQTRRINSRILLFFEFDLFSLNFLTHITAFNFFFLIWKLNATRIYHLI